MADRRRNIGIPAGVTFDFAGTEAPYGYLMCFGQAISRAEYPALFLAIGTTYGVGDGSTTFNLPDCRGRVKAGKDNMGGSAAGQLTSAGSGVDGTTLGFKGGAQTHTLSSSQLPSHSHTVANDSHSHTINSDTHTHTFSGLVSTTDASQSPANYITASRNSDSSSSFDVSYIASDTHTHTIGTDTHNHTVNDSGQTRGSAHQNTQPTIIFNTIIKV